MMRIVFRASVRPNVEVVVVASPSVWLSTQLVGVALTAPHLTEMVFPKPKGMLSSLRRYARNEGASVMVPMTAARGMNSEMDVVPAEASMTDPLG